MSNACRDDDGRAVCNGTRKFFVPLLSSHLMVDTGQDATWEILDRVYVLNKKIPCVSLVF